MKITTLSSADDEFEKLAGERRSVTAALAMPGSPDIEFDPPRFADLLLAFPGERGDIPERLRKHARALDENSL
ncbi:MULTISPECIES: hypothetical protein [Brucella]|uniref:hypothetical protein n=1 Tax=Brucella TaxID=234 RepID=UPI001F2400CF|nr:MULTISPECIES: hypothetical protein [Brucella]